jgi:TonB family protein
MKNLATTAAALAITGLMASASWASDLALVQAREAEIAQSIAKFPKDPSGFWPTLSARIKSNIAYTAPAGLAGNPPVEHEMDLRPDGNISAIRIKKSSGLPEFDRAVMVAIVKAQPFPKYKNGKVPEQMIMAHRPKPH